MKRELIYILLSVDHFVWSQEYQRTETGIKASIFGKKIDVEVQWFNANSLRVLKMPHGQSVDKKSLSVSARPEKTVLKGLSRQRYQQYCNEEPFTDGETRHKNRCSDL